MSTPTNPTIAQQLFITIKTVEWHLTNAYRKLGTRSRDELGAHLQDGAQVASLVRSTR